MPEITLLLLGLLLVMFGLGFVLGWILRGGRIRREKAAINVSWQDQMSAKKMEHERLAEQNKALMEQISQYQASRKDSELRAKELSASLKETFEIRDELRAKLKEAKRAADLAVSQRSKIKSDLDARKVQLDAAANALKDKDEKIFNLSRELESWQNRLPPLIERFRLRDLEAQEMEVELQKAQEQVASLDQLKQSDETRIEPIESSPLAGGMDASNDQYEETSEFEAVGAEEEDSADEQDEQEVAADAQTENPARASKELEAWLHEVTGDASDQASNEAATDEVDPPADTLSADEEPPEAGANEDIDDSVIDEIEPNIEDSVIDSSDSYMEAADDAGVESTDSLIVEELDASAIEAIDVSAIESLDDADEETEDSRIEQLNASMMEAINASAIQAVDSSALENADPFIEESDDSEPDEADDISGDEMLASAVGRLDDEAAASGDASVLESAEIDSSAPDERIGADEEDLSGQLETLASEAGLEELLEESSAEDIEASVIEQADGDNGLDEELGAGMGDDLQQIKGVGPAIEKTLHSLGIRRFQQIAEMSEYEIDRVARELRGFRSRIYREDWIGQAKMLQAEKREPVS